MKDLEDAMKYEFLRIIFLDESKVNGIKCIFLIMTEEIFLKEKNHINRFNKHTEHQVARGRKNLPILYLKHETYT